MLIFETPTDRLDRLIFDGQRRLTVDGVACWCPVGRHWFTFPLPDEITEAWWDAYSHAMVADHERCDAVRSGHAVGEQQADSRAEGGA